MTLIRFENLHLAYGPTPLLKEADLVIEEGEKLALLGRNGAGKSSLLKLVEGEIYADDGQIWRKPELKIGTLPQVLPAADERTVYQVVAEGLAEAGALLEEFHRLTHQAEHVDLKRLEQLQHQLEAIDGWNLQKRVEQMLKRLQLDADTLMASLSGGWRRRVALAKALVSEPDLLLLDEPTNHLDIDTIQWLEEQIKQFPGAVMLITHDRAFMQAVATRMIELDLGQITSWEGRYLEFLDWKQHQLEIEARHQAEFDRRLAQEETWIRQGIKARRTRNEGRVRALKAMRQERAARLKRQGKAEIQIESADRSGKLVAELTDVSVDYGEKPIIQHLNMSVMRGDRIGLLGRNGAGKTTLLKLLLGELSPTSGQVKIGTKLEVAYFDQLRAGLDPDKNVLDNLAEGRTSVTINGQQKHVMGYLQDFLFTPERARQPVRALSGGEQNRLLLARLFAQPSNLLVMDEPTNDLDLETLELLEERLAEYPGTLLLVSHDRAFLDNVVTSIVAFEGQGKIREYVGGYEDWIRQGGRFPALSTPQSDTVSATTSSHQEKAAETTPSRKKLSYKYQRELDQLPAQIEQQEAEIAAQEAIVGDPGFYSRPTEEVTVELAKLTDLQNALEALMERWLELEAMAEG